MKNSSKSRSTNVPTLQIIAEKAGVSRETVSQILGGKRADRYKQATREKVMEIAEQLNYRPHRGAQAMKAGRSNLIAIVHFGVGIEAAHKTNLALSQLVNEMGYDYLAMDMNWYGGSMERTVAEIIRARVEGVLVSHIQDVFSEQHIAELKSAGIPVVCVNGGYRHGVPLICDNKDWAFQSLTRHLLNMGHRHILQLVPRNAAADEAENPLRTQRADGFRKAIEQRGQWFTFDEEDYFANRESLHDSSKNEVRGITVQQEFRLYERLEKPVYRFCSRLFSYGILPDAIVCSNDFYSMEAIAAGLEAGVRIPDHVAITGYDNDRIGEFPAFGITTAEQNIDGICAASVEALKALIDNPEANVPNQMFDSRIIIRSSSGSPGISRRIRTDLVPNERLLV